MLNEKTVKPQYTGTSHPDHPIMGGGGGGQKDLHRNVFEKNTTKLINYVEMSFAMLFRFCEHIKIHPYFVKISEKQA